MSQEVADKLHALLVEMVSEPKIPGKFLDKLDAILKEHDPKYDYKTSED